MVASTLKLNSFPVPQRCDQSKEHPSRLWTEQKDRIFDTNKSTGKISQLSDTMKIDLY